MAISNPPPGTPPGFKWTGATSLYGISDLRSLAEDTHKFESEYLNGLIGGSYEEVPEVFKERSPISHVDGIDTPLLVSFSDPILSFWGLGAEINRGMYRSSRGQRMRSFRHPKPSLSCVR